MISVVIDTNVVISALLFGGTPGRLVPLWESGAIVPYASRPIIEEYLRVLTYPKFQLTEKEIEFLLYQEILPFFQHQTVMSDSAIVADDPSDDIFLHCAEAAGVNWVLSGDRHLLSLKRHGNIRILPVSRFLQIRPTFDQT